MEVERPSDWPAGLEEQALHPEEAALLLRLKVFIAMRWLAAAGVIVATGLATLVFRIGFDPLPIYAVAAAMVLYNILFFLQARGMARAGASVVKKARSYGYVQVFTDLIALTLLLHFAGGVENPFLFSYVFHIIIASILLHYRMAYALATVALVLVALLLGLEYAKLIPHIHLAGFAPPTLHEQGSYVAIVLVALATILYGSAYMVTAVSGELRKRQRQVVALGQRQLEERTNELGQATRALAKLEEERARFLRFISIAAHDLKAPLAAIQSYLGVMLGGFSGELNEKQRNMLERSSRRIVELLNLISDLLDIPRIETGQLVREMKMVSLKEISNSCLEVAQGLAQQKGVEVAVECPESLPQIYASPSRLQQVITNLLSNGVAYTPQGGRVTLRLKEASHQVVIEVIDTGVGIPSEDLPHIFEEFYRGSNVEARGTGLGLSIAKRIVEAHGGSIGAESPCPESGQGSKFTCTLPLRAGPAG